MKNSTRSKIVITAMLIVCCSQPAFAKWQFAEWGMSPAEVEIASKGDAPQSLGQAGDQIPGYNIGNEGTYSTATHNFSTKFYYQGDKLIFVKLNTDSGCQVLFNQLQSTYGKPAYDNRSPIVRQMNWRDTASQNKISVTIIGADSCSIEYEGISQNASGL